MTSPKVRRSVRRRFRGGLSGVLVGALLAGALVVAGVHPALARAAAPQAAPARQATAAMVPVSQRDAVLPAGWRTSADRVVTTDGDATGLHLLVAEQRSGYAWRTVTTLTEPGTDTDQWIGQSCVTGSGRRAVVVYAPRALVNREDTFRAGALVAIVDLDSSRVTKLPMRVSMAYYNPGCGADERVALTAGHESGSRYLSRIATVDAATAAVSHAVDVAGQVTSAVPFGAGIVAAKGAQLVTVDHRGQGAVLARTGTVPLRLGVDSSGGIGYETQSGDTVTVHRFDRGRDEVVRTAPRGSIVLRSAAGHLSLLGAGTVRETLPAGWSAIDSTVDAEPSTTGTAAVVSANSGREAAATGARTGKNSPVSIRLRLSTTARELTFTVPTELASADGSRPSPALSTAGTAAGDYSSNPTDPDRACAIARNDTRNLAFQETAAQAEWAADLAVKGALTQSRPAGWNGSDLPAYTPQGLFPSHPLSGGGQVPAQVLLGVLAQESNLWQASSHAVDGESGNFEQGGFYGSNSVDSVNWARSDCGYGAAQVTTGMRIGDSTYSHTQQLAIALDYAANIAAGLQILQDKWNQLAGYGMTVNNGDPKYIENWWLALWAYNSGYHLRDDPSDPHSHPDVYGLGWSNNPINEDYPADRTQFLDNPDDAKHPNLWTYPERVMGFAGRSLVRYDYSHGEYRTTFTKGNWTTADHRRGEPQHDQFCTVTGNQCDINHPHQPANFPDDPGGPCQRDDLACFWHLPARWLVADRDYVLLGTEVVIYQPGAAEPTAPPFYRSDCRTDTLPAGALVIDDQSSPAVTSQHCPSRPANQGSFALNFAADSTGHYPSKIDFHQLDTGFGGHFWFAHTWNGGIGGNAIHRVTGTWTLNRALSGWARVLVYLPDHGADSPQQWYTVHGADTISPTRSVTGGNYVDKDGKPAGAGTWRSLGVFNFTGGIPSITLDNLTRSGVNPTDDKGTVSYTDGSRDVSWDAVAFQPLPGKPSVQLTVVGDSYTSGEGTSYPSRNGVFDYYPETDHDGHYPTQQDACHRSVNAWSRLARLPGNPGPIGARADAWDPGLEYQLRACSGAVAANVMPTRGTIPNSGQYSEGAQLDQGYLDQYTNYVALSLGGNDARFKDVLTFCVGVTSFTPCPRATYQDDGESLLNHEPKVIEQSVVPAVRAALLEIHRMAPNAKIMVMGYPRLMDPDSSPTSVCWAVYGKDAVAWFGQISSILDTHYSAMVTTLVQQNTPVTYSTAFTAFYGKEACGTYAEYVNTFVLDFTPGDTGWAIPDKPVSQQSFHPTPAGSALYANVFTEYLKIH